VPRLLQDLLVGPPHPRLAAGFWWQYHGSAPQVSADLKEDQYFFLAQVITLGCCLTTVFQQDRSVLAVRRLQKSSQLMKGVFGWIETVHSLRPFHHHHRRQHPFRMTRLIFLVWKVHLRQIFVNLFRMDQLPVSQATALLV
jgi:hypothetical protein